VYCYFNVPPTAAVFHFLGEPSGHPHLVVRDLEIALSPPWSIHSGVGTAAYASSGAWGREPGVLPTMDPAPVAQLR